MTCNFPLIPALKPSSFIHTRQYCSNSSIPAASQYSVPYDSISVTNMVADQRLEETTRLATQQPRSNRARLTSGGSQSGFSSMQIIVQKYGGPTSGRPFDAPSQLPSEPRQTRATAVRTGREKADLTILAVCRTTDTEYRQGGDEC